MFRIIHPNRWFIWTIALIVMIFIVVWGAVERYAIEQEYSYTGDEIYYSVRLHKKTSPSAVDTSSWKTYRDEEYGFELQYPQEWLVSDPVEGIGVFIGQRSDEEIIRGITIQTTDISFGGGSSVPQIVARVGENNPDPNIDYSEYKLVAGEEALLITDKRDGRKGVRFNHKGSSYAISNSISSSSAPLSDELFTMIIATVQFLN